MNFLQSLNNPTVFFPHLFQIMGNVLNLSFLVCFNMVPEMVLNSHFSSNHCGILTEYGKGIVLLPKSNKQKNLSYGLCTFLAFSRPT